MLMIEWMCQTCRAREVLQQPHAAIQKLLQRLSGGRHRKVHGKRFTCMPTLSLSHVVMSDSGRPALHFPTVYHPLPSPPAHPHSHTPSAIAHIRTCR
jgi:hypothetical protein